MDVEVVVEGALGDLVLFVLPSFLPGAQVQPTIEAVVVAPDADVAPGADAGAVVEPTSP